MRAVLSLFSKSEKGIEERAIRAALSALASNRKETGSGEILRGLFFRAFDEPRGYVKRRDIKKRMERMSAITFAFDPSYFAPVVV